MINWRDLKGPFLKTLIKLPLWSLPILPTMSKKWSCIRLSIHHADATIHVVATIAEMGSAAAILLVDQITADNHGTRIQQ